ncbi:site-specific integrase [Solimonas sp. SE-A11]|uniref:site-specific integrase n=1 Tax=Solimonas sp. SE-A11 TaxID=3054954 RepID=UPI00259C80A1|nr:site-specific integrase [Solimonas sp. SE-A11]MDM4771170.1 site-specific integrase [Solimonas sp. SE-A11]
MVGATLVTPAELSNAARSAADEILIAGESENTIRSYRSAMRYWCAWGVARYGQPLHLPVSTSTVVQFIVDHLARGPIDQPVSELPPAIDAQLVKGGFKAHLGPLKISTVIHRLSVLSKLHQMRRQPNPCEDPQVRHLLSRARRAASKRGEFATKKTAATREPLKAMLTTCDESLEGLRDRALLLFAWSSGGRRRSEVSAATLEHLSKSDGENYSYKLHRSKTNQDGTSTVHPDKPIRGQAAEALKAWLNASAITDGPIFRRLWKSRVGPPLAPGAVASIVRKRAMLAGLNGDWAGHSLRSGFISEAGRRNIPIGDVMAMTEHRRVETVLGYYRVGELARSPIGNLLDD